jgi:hypothetical protein
MEKDFDEGLWTHATALDPDTYVYRGRGLDLDNDIVSLSCKTASLYLPIGKSVTLKSL